MTHNFWKKLVSATALSASVFALSAGAHAQGQIVTIGQIQGAGDASPLAGQTVTLQGIVTADFRGPKGLNGFFVQDAQGDNDPKTSDAVFVFTPARGQTANVATKAGNVVRLTGRVEEHEGLTEITAVSALAVTGNAPVPAPVAVQFPLTPSDRERYEGMLVSFPQVLTVADVYNLGRYGSLVLSQDGRMFVPTNGQTKINTKEQDDARQLVLDDGSDGQNPEVVPFMSAAGTRRSGDTLTGLTGILTYLHDEYRLEPTIAPVFVDANPRPVQPPAVGGNFRVASFNLENYFTTPKDADPSARGPKTPEEHDRQATKIVKAIQTMDADVLGLIEVENNGETTINDLVTRLNAAYGKTAYAAVPPPATGLGTDRIRVAMIYKPATVSLRGDSLSMADPIYERFPMAQTFVPKNGDKAFTLVVNHWKSKNLDKNNPLPDNDPNAEHGQGGWNAKRVQQAQTTLRFVNQLAAITPDVLVVGDLNTNGGEDPIKEMSKSLTYLNLREPESGRYSFVYKGMAGALDHAFATKTMATRVAGLDEWHINSDEPTAVGYDAKSQQNVLMVNETPYRSSDHDPLLIGLN